jgi:hypothetical protein
VACRLQGRFDFGIYNAGMDFMALAALRADWQARNEKLFYDAATTPHAATPWWRARSSLALIERS